MRVLKGRDRVFVVVGVIGLLVGAIDPLEGSLLILPSAILLTVGVRRATGGLASRLATVGLVSIALGFTAMWVMTAIGGVGGSTGRSAWWALLALPMLPGWILSVTGGVMALRKRFGDERHAT